MLVAPGQWLSVEVISPPRGCLAVSGDALVLTAGGGAPGVYWREARGTAGRLWGTGPPPKSAGGGRGLLWAPLGAGSPGQSVRLQGSLKGGGWLVRQPEGHSQAQARHGGGKRGHRVPQRGEGGGGWWWGAPAPPCSGRLGGVVGVGHPPGPGPRHLSPTTPFLGPVPALLHSGVTREA